MFYSDDFHEVTHDPPPQRPGDDAVYLLARARAILKHNDPAHREHVALAWENRELHAEIQPAPYTAPAGESDAGRGIAQPIDSTPSPPLIDAVADLVDEMHSAQLKAIARRSSHNAY